LSGAETLPNGGVTPPLAGKRIDSTGWFRLAIYL
jgi:hypothetical protein